MFAQQENKATDCLSQTLHFLLNITNNNERTPISSVARPDAYPFDIELPPHSGRIVVIGSSLETLDTYGFLKILGWRLGGSQKRRVTWLRQIGSTPDPSTPTQRYHFFEVGITLGQHLSSPYEILMCGESMYEESTNQVGRRLLDAIWTGLSEIYQVPYLCTLVDYSIIAEGDEYIDDQRIRYETEYQQWDRKQRSIIKTRPHFRKGQDIVWSTQAFHNPPFHIKPVKKTVLKVLGVEIIPDYCSCGMKETTPLEFHHERCNLQRRCGNMHHQILTVQIGDRRERLSGIYFIPFEHL